MGLWGDIKEAVFLFAMFNLLLKLVVDVAGVN
jgi:hypothetical protein